MQFVYVFFPLGDDLALSGQFFLAHLVLHGHHLDSLEGGKVVLISQEEARVESHDEADVAESLLEDGLPAGGLV